MLYKIQATKNPSKKDMKEIKQIVLENHISNHGTLMHKDLINHFNPKDELLIIARQDKKCVGFVLVHFYSNILYVEQVAVANDHKHKGLGSAMYDYIKKSSLGFKEFSAHVRQTNHSSLEFHKSLGFKITERYSNQYYLTNDLEEVNDRTTFKKQLPLIIDLSSENEIEQDI